MLHTIDVKSHSKQDYPIHIASSIWEEFRQFCSRHFSDRQLVIIIDEKVHKLHGETISRECKRLFSNCRFYPVPEGEQSKSQDQWQRLVDGILNDGVERGTPVLVVGGGVTGDVGGFTAASVMRGLPLLHMPTSLLAMVDSSIGGKTGINHTTGKNLIGAFYQPKAVFVNVDFLNTLEPKEWINGLGEVIKYGAISDPALLDRTEKLIKEGFQPSDGWADLIAKCATVKAEIVQKDTLESGVRAYLNFGHTFAHALEKKAGYGKISHGKAVFIGMLAALYASAERGADVSEARFASFLPLFKVDLNSQQADITQLVALMKRDKKVKQGTIRLILLNDWGAPYIYKCNEMHLINRAWKHAFNVLTQDSLS